MLTRPGIVEQDPHRNTAIPGGMNVAAAIVEAEDDGAIANNLLEALEAGHRRNRGDFGCWHTHHKRARRGGQGGSGFLHSSALAA
jgi:hypothetical protein